MINKDAFRRFNKLNQENILYKIWRYDLQMILTFIDQQKCDISINRDFYSGLHIQRGTKPRQLPVTSGNDDQFSKHGSWLTVVKWPGFFAPIYIAMATRRSCILEVPVLYFIKLPWKTFHGNHTVEFPRKTSFSVVIPRGQKHENCMKTDWNSMWNTPWNYHGQPWSFHAFLPTRNYHGKVFHGNCMKSFPWNVFHDISMEYKAGTYKRSPGNPIFWQCSYLQATMALGIDSSK